MCVYLCVCTCNHLCVWVFVCFGCAWVRLSVFGVCVKGNARSLSIPLQPPNNPHHPLLPYNSGAAPTGHSTTHFLANIPCYHNQHFQRLSLQSLHFQSKRPLRLTEYHPHTFKLASLKSSPQGQSQNTQTLVTVTLQ